MRDKPKPIRSSPRLGTKSGDNKPLGNPPEDDYPVVITVLGSDQQMTTRVGSGCLIGDVLQNLDLPLSCNVSRSAFCLYFQEPCLSSHSRRKIA